MIKVVEIFGSNIRRLRKDKGYSQERLAELSGLSREHIARLETGYWGSPESVAGIAKALKCSESDLFTDRTTSPSPTLNEALAALTKAVQLLATIPSNALEILGNFDWENPKTLEFLKANHQLHRPIKIKKIQNN